MGTERRCAEVCLAVGREFQREGEDSPHYLGRKMAIKHPSIRGNHITWEGGRINIVIIEPS